MEHNTTRTVALLGSHNPLHHSPYELEFARVVGAHLAQQGAVVATGTVSGFPLWASLGAREEGGVTLGFSPGSSKYEHEHHFRLSSDNLSSIIYTGFGLLGRDLIMVRSADIIVVFLGDERAGHEIALARELQKPVLVVTFQKTKESAQELLGDFYDYVECFDSQESILKRLQELITH